MSVGAPPFSLTPLLELVIELGPLHSLGAGAAGGGAGSAETGGASAGGWASEPSGACGWQAASAKAAIRGISVRIVGSPSLSLADTNRAGLRFRRRFGVPPRGG